MDHLRPKYVTPEEAAVHFRCCRQTIYKRFHRGIIPHRRFGDAILVSVSILEEDAELESNDAKKGTTQSGKTKTVQFPASQSQNKGKAQMGEGPQSARIRGQARSTEASRVVP